MQRFLIKKLISLFFKVKIKNKDYIEDMTGKQIYVLNHQSYIDAIIVSLFLKKDATYVMKKDITEKKKLTYKILFSKKDFKDFMLSIFCRYLQKFNSIILVNSSSPYSLKQMIDVVNDNKILIIFPEGVITTNGQLQPIQDGAGLVAEKTGATVIPIRIDGLLSSYFSRIKGKKNIFNTVTLTIKNPIKFLHKTNYKKLNKEKRIKILTKLLEK